MRFRGQRIGVDRALVASHADVLRGSSRVPAPRGTRDEPLRKSAWEVRALGAGRVYLEGFENGHFQIL